MGRRRISIGPCTGEHYGLGVDRISIRLSGDLGPYMLATGHSADDLDYYSVHAVSDR